MDGALILKILLSIIIFRHGYYLGIKKSDLIPCPSNNIKPILKLNSKPCYYNGDVCKWPTNIRDINHEPFIIHRHDIIKQKSVTEYVFSTLHHPEAPTKSETILSNIILSNDNPYSSCNNIYLTRTGSGSGLPNKCVAIATVKQEDISPWVHSHRMGTSAKLTNQYQNDVSQSFTIVQEIKLLPPIITGMKKLVDIFISKVGKPLNSDGSRRTAIIMVANEGVMDLLLNFMCSGKSANIDLSSFVVFVGQLDFVKVIENMGANAIYSNILGDIPSKAAETYGDLVFAKLMWLKATSVYVASAAGFNVLFQDADLIWITDPIPLLQSQLEDISFMDDGARTPRFTPFFVNSGFYFQKYNIKTLYLMERMIRSPAELFSTHSHQATLTRYITETHHLFNLKVKVLDQKQFPSGIMYHHDKQYLKDVLSFKELPFVWHMCWTSSRNDKVKYFKELGMWFINESKEICYISTKMLNFVNDSNGNNNIKNECCYIGEYWINRTIFFK